MISEGEWIAISHSSHIIQGYLDDDGFVEGQVEDSIVRSQRELMRHRLRLQNSVLTLWDGEKALWSGAIRSSEDEFWVEADDSKEGYLLYSGPESWSQVLLSPGETLTIEMESLEGGQVLMCQKWLFNLAVTIRLPLNLSSDPQSNILSAIADQPLTDVSFGTLLNLRQWTISPPELMVLLERPELKNLDALDVGQVLCPNKKELSWVLKNAWHSQNLKRLTVDGTALESGVGSVLAHNSYTRLTLEDYSCTAQDIDIIGTNLPLESLSIACETEISLFALSQCFKLESLFVDAAVSQFPEPVILQHLKQVVFPQVKWGDWTEDLQLHQIEYLRLNGPIPSTEVLHLESLTELDIGMPSEEFDSFSLHRLCLRGGKMTASLMRQLRTGCPRLNNISFCDAEIGPGVLPLISDLTHLELINCQIHPDQNLKTTNWETYRVRDSDCEWNPLNGLGPKIKYLDLSGSGTMVQELLKNGHLTRIETLLMDGCEDSHRFFQANGLISMSSLSLRNSNLDIYQWLSQQACLQLLNIDLGGCQSSRPLSNVKALRNVQRLRVSPDLGEDIIDSFACSIHNAAAVMLVHPGPLESLYFTFNPEVYP